MNTEDSGKNSNSALKWDRKTNGGVRECSSEVLILDPDGLAHTCNPYSQESGLGRIVGKDQPSKKH
jgi:hypothetical protein